MVDVTPDPRPQTEGGIGRAKPKQNRAVSWSRLHTEKGGPCRLCGGMPYMLHHVLSRARGGPDLPWNLVPLCRQCHHLIHQEDPATKRELLGCLTEEEYDALIVFAGPGVIARLFGA